jgi:2-dehydro-3-deoxyphosphogluconate aldolase/(4S)-4-hydroxy-2-oxoglutarate aldolase
VLRPQDPALLAPLLERLQDLGLLHVEIAWQPGPGWVEASRELRASFPALHLGAASICSLEALRSVEAAGFDYAVSPILDRALLQRAQATGLTLVPGVMTPTEVHQARAWGSGIVKLFPASSVGPGYWPRLMAPLGTPLPFCIAAGGLGPADVEPWLAAGVDAVALGSGLFQVADGASIGSLDLLPLQRLLVRLGRRSADDRR